MSTTGHETEAINVQGLKASLKKGGNIGIFNEAICSTAGSTAAKITNTTPPSFTLSAGAKILVKFTYAISAENSTLQVGSNTAKPIYYKGAALPANLVKAGTSVLLAYDGTSYNIVGDLNTDTTYSTMGASGSTHAGGLVPDTPSTAGTTKFLREDATWQEVNASPEVQIGGSTPTSESEIKLFVDENSDDTVEVYTKAQANILYAGKTDKLPMTGAGAATENNFMAIDSNGNIKDSGKNANSFQLKVTDCAMLGGGYATCSTAGGTAAKTVTISNFLLLPNCRISVLFTNAFTATNPTLSINGGTAKAIMHFGRAMETGKVHANTILTMVYDGTYWQVIGSESLAGSSPSGFVDLGLPSGLLWCEHNVGAATPYEDGLYFSWGNVIGHTGDDGYDFGSNNSGTYASTTGAALTGNIPTNSTYDAARHIMGAPCRLPSQGDFLELANNCDAEWFDNDNFTGRRLTSRINGNSIFFSASGYRYGTMLTKKGEIGNYWASTLYSSDNGCDLYFHQFTFNAVSKDSRFTGFSVRAVM